MPALADPRLKTVDELLMEVDRSTEGHARLVGEHLQAARNNWLGAMPREFDMNIDLARRAAGLLQDRSLRERIVRRTKSLLERPGLSDHN
jgi:hypothetical protein